jgi:hypothetical protein
MLRESNGIGHEIDASPIGTRGKYYEINRTNDTCTRITVDACDLIRMRRDVTARAVFVSKHDVGKARRNIQSDSKLLLQSMFIGH